MADIGFSMDATKAARVYDKVSDQWPELHHAWVRLDDRSGSQLTLHMGYGVPDDAEIIANSSLLIAALEELRSAARDRITDRELLSAAKATRTDAEAVSGVAGLTPDAGDHYVREALAS